MMPMITPNSPRALPKISTTKIFTNSVEFWASDKAQLLPTIPTHILQQWLQSIELKLCALPCVTCVTYPHTRFAKPQVTPEPKMEYPEAIAHLSYTPLTG
jgi:hypothetical protein